MLFWLFVIVFVVGLIFLRIYSTTFNNDWCMYIGSPVFVIGSLGLIASIFVLSFNYFGLNGYIAEKHIEYESLFYQYENNVYDNDNDLGKRDLLVDIQKWNENLAWNQKNQDDFWIGIYIPNIYNQFEFITLEK